MLGCEDYKNAAVPRGHRTKAAVDMLHMILHLSLGVRMSLNQPIKRLTFVTSHQIRSFIMPPLYKNAFIVYHSITLSDMKLEAAGCSRSLSLQTAQGGAHGQFAAVPLNLLGGKKQAWHRRASHLGICSTALTSGTSSTAVMNAILCSSSCSGRLCWHRGLVEESHATRPSILECYSWHMTWSYIHIYV